ncbi:MAG: glycosyltransferase [Candidatus Scalindua sp.]|nr:glycosyltransferase [Candidatus Scalindua sp.]
MIFIGPELSDPHAHFVTNIVSCIGTDDDLIIDLFCVAEWDEIRDSIANHLESHDEYYVIYNAYEDEDFFIYLKQSFPELKLITVFSDDEWRHANYDRYLALYSDIFTIAVKDNINRYERYGLKPFYMKWACNPDMFYPLSDQRKDIDVSFIGVPYGNRLSYIRFLIKNEVNVRVYGKGWDRFVDLRSYWGGFLTNDEMLQVIDRSKINLNFLWTSAVKEYSTIKGRTLELSACRSFQLSNHTDEFHNYGFMDGDNIAVFHDQSEMLAKVQYYLTHDGEREEIAKQAYKHVLQKHTWKQRFKNIFEQLTHVSYSSLSETRKYRIIVISKEGIQHKITPDDERLDVEIVDSTSGWRKKLSRVDGVIQLTHDSTINNESLYMMAFGLVADKSDMVAANFYVGYKESRKWIRFKDRQIERRRDLLRLLPIECLMFSGDYASRHGCSLQADVRECKVSYIEYPFFGVKLSYYWTRKLRLYFAHHRDSRSLLRKYVRGFKWGKVFSLGIDKLWQKMIFKKEWI